MGEVWIVKHRAARDTWHPREDSGRRGQPRTQETGSEIKFHLREDLRHVKKGDKINVNHVGRRSSGGELLEWIVWNHANTLGYLCRLFERKTGGPRLIWVDGPYIELKVRRIGHNAMLEQDAVHIGCGSDLAAHVIGVQGRQLSVKGPLYTGAVVSVMPVSTWTDMEFDKSDLIPTNIRLSMAIQGAIYLVGRTFTFSLQLGGKHFSMSFLVVENLDESDQFILGRVFVRMLAITIDLNDWLIRIKEPVRKYEKKSANKILINQAKVPIFLNCKIRLKPKQAE